MSKGGYNGGSTVVGPESGWFTSSPRKGRKVHRATACGNEFNAKLREQRENWDFSDNKTAVVSRDELSVLVGKSAKELLGRGPSPITLKATEGPPTQSELKKNKQMRQMAARARKRAKLGLD